MSAGDFIRATRVASALESARGRGWSPPPVAGVVVSEAVAYGDEGAALRACLKSRHDLREAIASGGSTDGWEAAPYSPLSPGWHAFLAGLVELTYTESTLDPPDWTEYSHLFLRQPSVLLLDGASATTVQARTPRWLAERNVFIDAKHLA